MGAQKAVLGQELSAYYPTISLANSYRTSNSTGGGDSTSDKAFDRISGQTNFNMTIYNFGKREGTVQSARDILEATGHDFRTATDEIVLAVKEAYYGYLQAQALVKVREETVKDRELLVRQAQGFYEVGTRPKIDVARAESNLFNARADLIAAQNAVKVAWVILKNAVGVRDFPERPLTEELTITPIPISLERARELAFGSRPELKSFEAQRKAQDERIAVARRGHLPDILFSASYGRQNTSRDGNTFPLQLSWSVQLNLNIPIFEGFRSTHRVEEALRNYYVIRAQEEDRRQQVALEVEQSYLKLAEAQERIKATEAAVRAAKENLDLAHGRYQVGVGSIIEITDAQTLHTDAQTNHIRSLYDYKIAEAQLLKAMGGSQP
jgi:outer membrane protein TolC